MTTSPEFGQTGSPAPLPHDGSGSPLADRSPDDLLVPDAAPAADAEPVAALDPPAATTSTANGPRAGRKPRAFLVGIGLAVASAAYGLFASLWMWPHLLPAARPYWAQTGDVWFAYLDSVYVANGALGYMYSGTPAFYAGPLYPMLLSPVTWAIDAFRLVPAIPNPLNQPSAWPALLGWGMLLSVVLWSGLWRIGGELQARRATRFGLMVAGAVVVGVAGATYGHFEDVITAGFVVWALAFAIRAGAHGERDDFVRAGVFLALAITTKQWAVLAAPILVAYTPRGRRLATAAATALLPVALYGFTLAVDWAHASEMLFMQRTDRQFGRTAPWFTGKAMTPGAGLSRLWLLVAVVALAIWVWRRPTRTTFLAAVGIALLSRYATEIVIHPYYLVPGLLVLVIAEVSASKRCWRTMCAGSLTLAWHWERPPYAVFWGVLYALLLVDVGLGLWFMYRARNEPRAFLRARSAEDDAEARDVTSAATTAEVTSLSAAIVRNGESADAATTEHGDATSHAEAGSGRT